jgi:CDP-4-dehydro-6-deoxyglucose reductase
VATFPVREVIHSTPRSRGISLDLGASEFPYSAGQAVMVGLNGSPLRKPYSIASAPCEVAQTGVMQLLIQIDDSALDPHLERATPGTKLDVEGPFGTFGLHAADSSDPLLFLAGGTGIAPLRSMLMERLARGAAPPIGVVYSARSPEEFAFRPELEALHEAGRIRMHFTVTRDEGGVWTGRRGRIDQALIEQALPSTEARCLLCGPPQLVRDTKNLLEEIGVSSGRIFTEQY